ncbi:MAG: prepilin-type N-terminal cleavage/methylation domain-containing protein [Candidatus Kaiserbacteria bacterium]|nr:prepilin-type N-terminal cleavage/methylation domain-containing protein [Candidatus Kaiserbacteria bacterium]
MTSHNKAFTLIELLVVVAILGVLAGIVVVPLTGKTFEARYASLLADIYGNRESIRGGIINWNFPVWNSASSFGNGERSSFHCPCLLRHNC